MIEANAGSFPFPAEPVPPFKRHESNVPVGDGFWAFTAAVIVAGTSTAHPPEEVSADGLPE